MKAKDLIEKLQNLDPESDVIINVMQYNKKYGVVQLPIKYSNSESSSWINSSYGGSITVHLSKGAYIAGLPKVTK